MDHSFFETITYIFSRVHLDSLSLLEVISLHIRCTSFSAIQAATNVGLVVAKLHNVF